MTDANGNYFTTGPTPLLNTWVNYTDTVGRTVLKIYKATNKITYQYQDAGGAWQTVELNLSTFNVKTNFACTSVSEYTGTAKLPVSLVLANGKQYTFTYEDTPGWSGYKSGRLKRVTFPTGGFYEYSYPTTGNKGISCPWWTGGDGRTTSLTRVINDGIASSTWQYSATMSGTSPNHFWTTVVTAPTLPYDSGGNQSIYTFGIQGNSRAETRYQGPSSGGQALRTVQTTFTPDANFVKRPTTIATTLENNQQSKVENTFDLFGNVTEVREFDWGTGAPGTSVIRKTTTSYLSTSAYTQRNILNRPTQVKVMDGTGVALQQTDILYDETTPISTAGAAVQHDYTNYGTTFNHRGNPTSVKQLVSGSTFLTTTNTYDDLGNLRSTTDPGGHTTDFSYTDNFSDGVNRNTFAYLTQVTKPSPFNGQTVQTKYYHPTGQIRSTIDENSREAISEYADAMKRPTKTTLPDGGEATVAYNDTARTVTTTQKRTATENITVVEQFDQLGRLSQTQLPGGRKVDVVYDVIGREWKTSNPYVSQGESTYGIVETRFDGIGRVKIIINQDLTSAQTEYAGNSMRTTDETGKQHITQTDALGRLTRVCEVTAGNTRSPSESCGMTGFGGGTGYLTTYTYSQDANENVTQISQGSQTRILRADKAGRQKSSKVIEVSTSTEVMYAYDSDGNQISVTDQRGTVCFEYDALHRLTKKRHPTGAQTCTNGNIAAEFAYDGTQANNAIGRLITEWDGTAGSSDKNEYTYDTLGRVLTANRTVSSTVFAMAYTYDLAGNLTSISYPSSSGTRRKVDYLYNATAELNIVRDATGTAFDYVTATTYSNLGPMQQVDLGNGVRTTLGWNKNGEMTSLVTQKVAGATHLSLGYTYFNNGQIQEISNALSNLKSEKYTYDQLRRLFTAQRGPDVSVQRKYQYDYDRYGNRWAQTLVAGSGLGGTLDLNSANNRVTTTGFSYVNGSGQDQAGNLTANGPGTSYSYNMENFMTAAGSTTYAYDAQGRRVRKTVGGTVTEYFYSGSELVAENTGGTWTDYIFFGDQRIAKQTGGPPTPGTGSATVNGSLQSIPGSGATPGTGSATVAGSEQSIAATQSTGWVDITGTEQSVTVQEYVGDQCVMYGEFGCEQWEPVYEWVTYWDSGGVSITVNGLTKTASYGQGSTGNSLATALANVINADGGYPVTASVSGIRVNLTSKGTGAATNYSLSVTSWTGDPGHFSGPSFVPVRSGAAMTGGANAIYDTGSVWVTVNGQQKSVSYGQGSTSSSVASALASAVTCGAGYPVSASLAGTTLTLTACASGAATNYSLAGGSSTSQPGSFAQPSFAVSVSGAALTGGSDGTAPTYDSGSVWVTVNGQQKSVSYGQGSTNTTVATALRDAINADPGYPVTAFLAGSTISVTAKTAGAGTNYSLLGGSSTSQPGSFGQPSFTVATSGSALIGGSDGGSTSAATAVYLHTDHLGSTRVCTDSNGVSTGTCDYEPFGEVQPGTTCSVPTNFRFAGMEWDANAGPNSLYHTWFRQYDPNQGRWMAVDPLAGEALDPQSLDRFAYALNDPANFTDPLGLAVFEGGRLHTEFLYNGLSVGADFLVDTGILKFWDIIELTTYDRGLRLGDNLHWVSAIRFASLLALLQGSQGQTAPPEPPVTPCRTSGTGFQTRPRNHRARDYGASKWGAPIAAADTGRVVGLRSGAPHVPGPYNLRSRQPAPPTNYVSIRTDSGYTVRYSHVTPASGLSLGDRVRRSQVVGNVDNSGRTTGPHTHVSVLDPNGVRIDPNRYFTNCK